MCAAVFFRDCRMCIAVLSSLLDRNIHYLTILHDDNDTSTVHGEETWNGEEGSQQNDWNFGCF